MKQAFLAIGMIAFAATANAADMSACTFDNDADQMIAACTEVIASDQATPKDLVDAYLYRCQAYDRKGEPNLGLADCLQSRRMDESNTSVHNSLSILYQNLGRFEEGVASAQQAVSLAPDDATARNTLSNATCRAGLVDLSVESRLEAMRLGRFDAGGLQTALKNRGYYSGPVDGKFGSGSQAALRAWTQAGCP